MRILNIQFYSLIHNETYGICVRTALSNRRWTNDIVVRISSASYSVMFQ